MATPRPTGWSAGAALGWGLACAATAVAVFQATRRCDVLQPHQGLAHLITAPPAPCVPPPQQERPLEVVMDFSKAIGAEAPLASVQPALPAAPRVLLVSAEQPGPCSTVAAEWLGKRAAKNRLVYAGMHGYGSHWCTDVVVPQFTEGDAMWNKPALLAQLLNSSLVDGYDWLLWMDADAIVTDASFQPPWEEYAAKDLHLVLWGETRKLDTAGTGTKPNYEAINAGVMLLRNSVWTRELLGAVLAAGADIEGSTAVQGEALSGLCDHGAYNCRVSDQSTLVYLLSREARWRNATLLEKQYVMNGHWQEYRGRLQPGSLQLSSASFGSDRVPWVLHYSGCQLCSGRTSPELANWSDCRDSFAEALTFAEDWALAPLGLRHANLTSLLVVPADGPPAFPAAAPAAADAAGRNETALLEAASAQPAGAAGEMAPLEVEAANVTAPAEAGGREAAEEGPGKAGIKSVVPPTEEPRIILP